MAKKARRTVLYSSKGKKLYAVRDRTGRFKDIQQYSRAHAMDMRRKSKDEKAAAKPARRAAKKTAKKAAKKSVRKTVKKTTRKVAKRTARKTVKKTARKSTRKTARKSTTRSRRPRKTAATSDAE